MSLSKWPFISGIVLLLCFQVIGGSYTYDQQRVSDQEYHLRNFNNLRLEEARANPDYDYSIVRASGTTLWQRIKNWFANFFSKLFSNGNTGMILQIIIYALIIGTAIFSILKFMGTNPANLLSRSKNQNFPYTVAEENIHEMDFEKEIGLAIDIHNYRLATRLIYLQALKLLSDLELIHWKPGKTNAEYFYELNAGILRSRFSSLGHIFEYAWYGGFEIEKSIMERARENLMEIKNQLKSVEN